MLKKIPARNSGTLPSLARVAILLLFVAGPAAGQAASEEFGQPPGTGGLLVTPKRVVFAGRERSAEIHLLNNGRRTTTYRVELLEMEMDASGQLTELQEATASSLGRMVRLAPRQVTIAAGERQTVRLLLRKPAGLAAGEYRSHLRLRAIPEATATVLPGTAEVDPGGISIRLVALPGISIPIIVRQGSLSSTIGLSQLTVETDGAASRVSMRLEREGQRSVYGDLSAVFMPAAGGAIPVAEGKGIAIYTSISSRTFSLPLSPPDGVSLSSGRLRVTFRSRPDTDGGGVQLTANAEVVLP